MHNDQNKKPRARIAWLSPDEGAVKTAAPQFAEADYLLFDGSGAGPADLAVIDFRARLSTQAAQRLAAATRRKAPECSLLYLGSSRLTAAERAYLRRSGELVLVEDDLKPAIEACRQRLRLRNIAEETGERLKTIAASTRLSEFPPIEAPTSGAVVLVAGAAGPSALAALSIAEKISADRAGVFSAGQVIRALETDAFDCAVFLAKADGDPLIGLARSMRRHRKFCDLPVILVGADERARARMARNWGAETLCADHLSDDLPGRIIAATRRARLIAAMRRFLSACAGEGVRDRLSGAFTPQFFHQHAERLFARAEHTGRPISLVGLRLLSLAPEGAEGGARLLTEAARLVNRVTRAEDCVGRLTGDTFVALMSATTPQDATRAARRIEGTIANTMFRARGSQKLFAVAAATAAVERLSGVCVEEAIAAVLLKLNSATPRTAER
ncbi:MAG: GGDEF domain-containing protein [Amphiplicatus sp.]